MKPIEVVGVDKRIDGKCVLHKVSLSITKGRVYRLYGDNGCGKTMLLKCILGIAKVDKGDVKICSAKDGSPVTHGNIFFGTSRCIFPIRHYPKIFKFVSVYVFLRK